jgi:uncharacterized membrane protein (DUF485 family)
MGRTAAWVISLALLAFTGVVGIYDGFSEWRGGPTPLERSVTVGILLYGLFGLASAYGLFRRKRWSLRTVVAWAVAVTYVPGVAVMAYAGEDATVGSAIAASVGSLVIALGVIWTTNVMTKSEASLSAHP